MGLKDYGYVFYDSMNCLSSNPRLHNHALELEKRRELRPITGKTHILINFIRQVDKNYFKYFIDCYNHLCYNNYYNILFYKEF